MALAILLIEILLLLFLTIFILNKYGNWRRQKLFITFSTLLAWYFSFIIITILPLDVSMTSYYQCVAKLNNSIRNIQEISHYNNASQNLSTQDIFLNYTHEPFILINQTLQTQFIISSAKIKHSKKRILNYDPHSSYFDVFAKLMENENSSDIYEECEKPWNFVPRNVLVILWRIVYWTSQVLTWIIIPMMQTYTKAGDFTVFGKIKTSLYENLLWYGTYLVIVVIICIYIALKPNLDIDASKLLLIASAASNTWGLILLVLLLGYGLIQVPRSVWFYSAFTSGGTRAKLARAFYKAAITYPAKQETEEELEDVAQEIIRISENVPLGHAVRPKIDILMRKVPDRFLRKHKTSLEENGTFNRLESAIEFDAPTATTLVKVHKRLLTCLTTHYRANMQWQAILDTVKAIDSDPTSKLNFSIASTKSNMDATSKFRPDGCYIDEDLSKYIKAYGKSDSNLVLEDGHLEQPENCADDIHALTGGRFSIGCRRFFASTIHFGRICGIHTKRFIRPAWYKILACLFCLLSIILIWSELFMFKRSRPILSIFAIFFQLAKSSLHQYMVVELVTFLTITYLSLCAYFTIFRLRIFDLYCLLPNHHTDEYSLLFSGMLISRLTSPLALNFLNLIHMDQGYQVQAIKDIRPDISTSRPVTIVPSFINGTQNATIITNASIVALSGGKIIETAFIQVMGRQTLIPFIGQGFNIYFPMLIAVLCLANYFDIVRKIGRSVGYNRFTTGDFNRFYAKTGGKLFDSDTTNTSNGTASITDEDDLDMGRNSSAKIAAMIQEGRLLIKREFRNRYLVTHNYKDLNNPDPSVVNGMGRASSSSHLYSSGRLPGTTNTLEAIKRKYNNATTKTNLNDISTYGATPPNNVDFLSNNASTSIYTSRDDLIPKTSSKHLIFGGQSSLNANAMLNGLENALTTSKNALGSFVTKFKNSANRSLAHGTFKDHLTSDFGANSAPNFNTIENSNNINTNSIGVYGGKNSLASYESNLLNKNENDFKSNPLHASDAPRPKIAPRNIFDDI